MIAFNGQYLDEASHGNMRITAACLGGQWVMGGWLKTATQQAIIAAFGAEGTEVIRKTNDYLNALALTDPTRAQQLAMFINEDPLLVTSLVETSKTRWLVGDGKAFIRSGIIANDNSGIELKFRTFTSENKSTGLLTVDKSANTQAFGVSRWDGVFVCWYGNQTVESRSIAMSTDITYHYKQNRGKIEITSSTGKSATKNFTLGSSSIFAGEFCFPATSRNGNVPTVGGLYEASIVKIWDNDMLVRDFIPCLYNGENGMLDIISGTFYPNANTEGAFTIAITDK